MITLGNRSTIILLTVYKIIIKMSSIRIYRELVKEVDIRLTICMMSTLKVSMDQKHCLEKISFTWELLEKLTLTKIVRRSTKLETKEEIDCLTANSY